MTPRPVAAHRRLARLAVALVLTGSLLAAPLGAPFATAQPPSPPSWPVSPFADIPAHWARPEIEALWARGAIEAPTGPEAAALFRPDDRVTRGEFVTTLVRALGHAAEAADLATVPPPFVDLGGASGATGAAGASGSAQPGPALAGYVNVATEDDLVRGYPDGTFGPERPITRAEISALLVRVLGLEPSDPGPAGLPFADQADVPAWAAGYIGVAYQRGMVRGYPDHSFRPREGATRAEAACLIVRAIRTSGQLFDLTGIVRGTSATGDVVAVDLWPAGSPEMTLSADGTAVFTPPAKLGPSKPGPTAFLRVPPTAIVYRHGAPASPADIRPLDEVSLVLDGTGSAAYVEVSLVDGVGRVVSADPVGALLTIEPLPGAGGGAVPVAPRTLPVLAWAPVFRDGREVATGLTVDGAAASALTPGTTTYFILEAATGSIRALAVLGPQAGPAAGAKTAEVEDPAASPVSLLGPVQAQKLNSAVIGADALRASTGADGYGITIAVVDTGVDVTHSDLVMTSSLERKVIDWRDFSGEGDVSTTRLSTASKGSIVTDLGTAQVGGIVSGSGFFHSGVFYEINLQPGSPLRQDLDRNGSASDRFLIVAVDRRASGVYDTVYVDTDRDLDLTDEVPLKTYRDSGQVAWFGDQFRGHADLCSFVLADLRPDGNQVSLGFDGNGHGTHVAGTAAAYGSYRGGIDGIAPGARIMALKALGSSGDGKWGDILRAVTYAAEHGASIITLAVSNLSEAGDISDETSQIAAIAERHGALVVVAAGNDGPGLSSARGPGGGGNLITVGASLTPEMWRSYYGYEVPTGTVWLFSSVGPRAGGSSGPDVVAPGCAISAAPRWLEPPGYVQYEGTSMSVPHVAGALALLWQAGLGAGLPVSAPLVRSSLLATAVPLDGYAFVEQGRGAVNAALAWEWLTREAAAQAGEGLAATAALCEPGGFFTRDQRVARVLFEVTGAAGPAGAGASAQPWLDVTSASSWLAPEKARLALPPGVTRHLPATVAAGPAEGLYSGRLVARDGPRERFTLPVTVVVPAELNVSTAWSFTAQGALGPARLSRHYFRVPPGVAGLELTCGVPAASGERGFSGRVRAYLYGPDGRLVAATGYVGEGSTDENGYATLDVAEPPGGVWEVVVYSSAALSAFGLSSSDYWLETSLRGLAYDLPGQGWDVSVPATAGESGASGTTAPTPALAASITRFWRPIETQGGQGAGVPVRVKGELLWINVQPGFDASIQGYGLWGQAWGNRPETVTLDPGETFTRALPPLGEAGGLLRVLLRQTPALGSGENGGLAPGLQPAALGLYLYRRQASGWQEMASSTDPAAPAQVLEVDNPLAGEYAVYVEADSGGFGPATFELITQWLSAGATVAPSAKLRTFRATEVGSLSVTAAVPPSEGVYRGGLRISDCGGRLDLPGGVGATASLLPLTVTRLGRPVLLTLAPGTAIPGRNLLTFEARDRSGSLANEFSLELDGRLYQASGGRVTVYRDIEGSGRTLRLEARLIPPDATAALFVFYLPVAALPAEAGEAPGGVRVPGWLQSDGYRPADLEGARALVAGWLWGG